jgi:transcriptional regulator with XRE-family HTH domain
MTITKTLGSPPTFKFCLDEAVCNVRAAYGFSKKQVAMMAGIDPSYITLVEEKGNIPSRNVLGRIVTGLEKIGGVSKQEAQRLYWSARVVPPSIPASLLGKYARLSSLPVAEQTRILNQIESIDSTT